VGTQALITILNSLYFTLTYCPLPIIHLIHPSYLFSLIPLPLRPSSLDPLPSFPSSLFSHFSPSLLYLILVPDFSLSISMGFPPSTLPLSLLTHISPCVACIRLFCIGPCQAQQRRRSRAQTQHERGSRDLYPDNEERAWMPSVPYALVPRSR
jgi:hypothetical protein